MSAIDIIQKTSPLEKRKIIYSDFHKDLSINPITEDLAVRTNEASVKEAMKNLLLTDRGERLFQPRLGGDIRRTLFENNTPITIKILEERVRDVINNYEPRASVIDVKVITLYDDNRIKIDINFYIRNNETPNFLSVFIDRVR